MWIVANQQKALPILEKYSTVKIEPFPVLQEAERMSGVAKLWKQDFVQAKELFKNGNIDSLQKSYDLFTCSIHSFPDSWLAGLAHKYRLKIFEMLGENEKAKMEKRRINEFYILQESE